jgi:hypothetical protein
MFSIPTASFGGGGVRKIPRFWDDDFSTAGPPNSERWLIPTASDADPVITGGQLSCVPPTGSSSFSGVTNRYELPQAEFSVSVDYLASLPYGGAGNRQVALGVIETPGTGFSEHWISVRRNQIDSPTLAVYAAGAYRVNDTLQYQNPGTWSITRNGAGNLLFQLDGNTIWQLNTAPASPLYASLWVRGDNATASALFDNFKIVIP